MTSNLHRHLASCCIITGGCKHRSVAGSILKSVVKLLIYMTIQKRRDKEIKRRDENSFWVSTFAWQNKISVLAYIIHTSGVSTGVKGYLDLLNATN